MTDVIAAQSEELHSLQIMGINKASLWSKI